MEGVHGGQVGSSLLSSVLPQGDVSSTFCKTRRRFDTRRRIWRCVASSVHARSLLHLPPGPGYCWPGLQPAQPRWEVRGWLLGLLGQRTQRVAPGLCAAPLFYLQGDPAHHTPLPIRLLVPGS